MKNLDFYITLVRRKSGKWNFRLFTEDRKIDCRYHDPLARYDAPSYALYAALQEAQKIAIRFGRKPAKVTVFTDEAGGRA